MQEDANKDAIWTSVGITAIMLGMIFLSWATVYLIVSAVINNAAASLVVQPH